ncbi:MAG: SDR family NAD(P)-dependent oxidoreductase [Spirochaetia bacterium]|nr:SDR family NAD(P)-dependent oxidoreductase [Spirochaetia bacterium]
MKLKGKVAVVAGATRGAGRGIATALGEAGMTVYVTGRTTRKNRSTMNRAETIEETAEIVTERGGVGIDVRVDHSIESEVRELFAKVELEQGRLDLLVNDIWGGDPLTDWEKKFWEHNLSNGLSIQRGAVFTHMITSYYAAPIMLKQKSGLIVEITDGVDYKYRGNLYYSMAKVGSIHLAEAMAADLKPNGITALAVTPGFLRSESMLEHFGVQEHNWREAIKSGKPHAEHFMTSETPLFVGRGVASLAADRDVFEKTGKVLSSWGLCDEYGFQDADGQRPHWGNYFATLNPEQ